MTQDDIVVMAVNAGASALFFKDNIRFIQKFAKLVAAKECEECAAILDANAMACHSPIMRSLLQSNAQAIRSRGTT